MSKSVWALAMLAVMGAATPALARSGERDTVYSTQSYFSGFQYRPLSVQIEGGATFLEGMESQDLRSGENIGLGFTWRPTSHLPFALRVDGMYEDFHDRAALLGQEAAALGTEVDWGKTRMWGGDVDAELDTLLSPRVRLYFLAGGGWYDRRETYYQLGIGQGVFCGWYYCFSGPGLEAFRVAEVSTGMKFERNAGAGLEFALGQGASLFVDARYVRFAQSGQKLDFVPVRIGLRF
jgi:Outer membrane protein beta-barrel domain